MPDAAPAGDLQQDVPTRGHARVKVCGITEPAELDALATHGVDFVGLWYGVPGGPADLPLDRWRELATAGEGGPEPVLVTFAKDAEMLAGALEGTGATWVQLHGYQMPGLIRSLKKLDPDVKVMKVLHVRGSECVEESFLGAYEKAGVDVFLLDAVSAGGQVGSTGETLDVDYALSLAEKLDRPFLLAGGISAANRDRFRALAEHPRFYGIDVDTNARGADGKVSAEKVGAIIQTWKEGADG